MTPAAEARIPSLDGLRAVSIAMVIFDHLHRAMAGESQVGENPLAVIAGNGSLGVSVFFVISGYLITTLLLRELDDTGMISLAGFYLRRTFRILPAYYVYIAVVAVLGYFGRVQFTGTELAIALTFTWDYALSAQSWALGHSWSLSVEEQFYLLWPTILRRFGRHRSTVGALAFIALGPAIRIGQYFLFGSHGAGIWEMLHTRGDTLMFGCVAALLRDDPRFQRVCRLSFPWVGALAAYAIFVSPLLVVRFQGTYLYTISYTIDGFAILMTMLWLIDRPTSLAGRLLNSRLAVHLGTISYSLYLWQQVFLNGENRMAIGRFPLNLAMMLVVAECSYFLVEKTGLRWRSQIQQRLSREPVETIPETADGRR